MKAGRTCNVIYGSRHVREGKRYRRKGGKAEGCERSALARAERGARAGKHRNPNGASLGTVESASASLIWPRQAQAGSCGSKGERSSALWILTLKAPLDPPQHDHAHWKLHQAPHRSALFHAASCLPPSGRQKKASCPSARLLLRPTFELTVLLPVLICPSL